VTGGVAVEGAQLEILLAVWPMVFVTPFANEAWSWRRRSESVASSVVSALKMLDFVDESSTTPALPEPALTLHLC
jgi:hypothetical protein